MADDFAAAIDHARGLLRDLGATGAVAREMARYPLHPRLSRLMVEARRRGVATVDGLQILVTQGALSFLQWTGRVAPLQVMRAAAEGGGNG